MSTVEIANEGLKVNFANQSPGAPPLVYAGDQPIDAVKIVPVKSTKNKAVGKFFCIDKITITWTAVNKCPHTYASHTFDSGSGSIAATAIKVKADGKFVLRKNDAGTCSGAWHLTASPFTPVSCACNIKISDAGQTKVKGA